MAAIAHVAVALAAKPLAKKVNVLLLIIASIIFDLLFLLLSYLGVENQNYGPWSHSLLMSIIWSICVGLLVVIVFHNWRIGILFGTIMFSHWIIDLITDPTGAVLGGKPLPPNLPLGFGDSPKVGFGLFNYSVLVAQIFEFSTLLLGLFIYIVYKVRERRLVRTHL